MIRHFLVWSLAATLVQASEPEFTVLNWNIWRGGTEKEESGRPEQVARLIEQVGPDVVMMQETYGSGPWLEQELGYHLRLRGPHLSIFSKHPVLADLSVGGEWNCIGALVESPDFGKIAVFSIWLPFDGDIWLPGSREDASDEQMLAVCEPSRATLERLLPLIEAKLAEEQLADIPVIVAGDFNSMSHLDYVAEAAVQFGGRVIAWPTSRLMTEAGFTDTYRVLHPKVDRANDATWTPEFPQQEQDRIDFIYSRGGGLVPHSSEVIRSFEPFFPSDHAALVTVFRREARD